MRALEAAGAEVLALAADVADEAQMHAVVAAARDRDGGYHRHSDYAAEPDPITRALIEDGRRNCMLDGPVEPGCPVEIIQGMRDVDVPYAHPLKIVGRLPAEGTALTLIADGDHRLSRPQDIRRLVQAVTGIA